MADAWCNRGIAYNSKGDPDRAMADLSHALALDPRCALAFLNRSIAYLQQGREAEARQDFDQCLKIDPALKPELEAVLGEARRGLRGLR